MKPVQTIVYPADGPRDPRKRPFPVALYDPDGDPIALGSGGSTAILNPVNTIADLPDAPVGNPVCLVKTPAPVLYAWDGTSWVSLSSGASGAGTNGFVASTDRPIPTGNVLWAPMVGGAPADLVDWEVYSGATDDPSTGVAISENAPSGLAHDVLWIPLWPTGVPKGIAEWQLVVGATSADTTQHCVPKTTRPVGPQLRTLWAHVDVDGALISNSLEVYT
jgi:hypothetical protein